jgi:hypothetical protein
MDRYRLGLVLLLLAALLGCNEQQTAYYPTVNAAVADRAFERGWLPEVLRNDVSEIRETHDLDSSRGSGSFQFAPSFVPHLETTCSRPHPADTAGNAAAAWPKVFGGVSTIADVEGRGFRAFRCSGFTVAVDSAAHSGYFWN